jgi:cytochrome c
MPKNADASRGKAIFDKTCAKCHRLKEKFLAPPLDGVVGRAKSSFPDHKYSAAIEAAGGTWTYEDLSALVANPAAYLPGTAMGFTGIPDNGERADVILYLCNLSADPLPLP